jgi:hypothetical protein
MVKPLRRGLRFFESTLTKNFRTNREHRLVSGEGPVRPTLTIRPVSAV